MKILIKITLNKTYKTFLKKIIKDQRIENHIPSITDDKYNSLGNKIK